MDSAKKKVMAKSADIAAGTLGGLISAAAKVFVTAVLIFITTGLLFTCVFAYYIKNTLTTNLDVSLSDFTLALSSTIWYTDVDGNTKELITLSGKENRIWVDFEDVPEYMWQALVAIEDKRFFEHKGVDWYRTVGAFGNMFARMKDDFGGSTITQQLLKNLTQKDDVTVSRKLGEIFQAMEFEKTYTKEELLEWYLNAVYFGEGCYGIYTAAQTYFGKNCSELTLAECASIIGITNQPTKYNPFINQENNKNRRETILKEMYSQGFISYEEYTAATDEVPVFVRSEAEVYEQVIYSYYVETVITDVIEDLQARKGISEETATKLLYSGGYQIYSCLDPAIQASVDSIYNNPAELPQPYFTTTTQQLQSAVIVIDPKNGNIAALSGGVGDKKGNFVLNRATQSPRPPGSSIKPIAVYAPAFEYGLITQPTLVNDAPDITLTHTPWYPRNSGGGNRGVTTIRQALISSLNTVSAQIIDKLTPAVSFEFLENRLGVISLVPDDKDYAPLSLGQLTYGITVREMAQAFGAFANDGIFTYARSYTRVTDFYGTPVMENPPKTINAMDRNTALNITDMLLAAVRQGTGGEAAFGGMPVAGKTGTTSDNKDRNFTGFTPYYVTAVWTGYDIPETMYFYGNPAAQIWKRIMEPIHEGLEYKEFPLPLLGVATSIFGDLQIPEPEPEPEPEEEEIEPDEPEEEPYDGPGTGEETPELFAPEDPDFPTYGIDPTSDPETPHG
ncbi:MAG: transglycosylase domain-containing protein [Oscillospiraceae bacterium]|nr:transglycosylase domain-containing protein [Oscillospiraceae bacterium]